MFSRVCHQRDDGIFGKWFRDVNGFVGEGKRRDLGLCCTEVMSFNGMRRLSIVKTCSCSVARVRNGK